MTLSWRSTAQKGGYPDAGDGAGHVEPEQRGNDSHEEEDDDAGEPVHQDDSGRLDQRPGVARAVPDADDVAPATRRKEIVKELGDKVRFGQKDEGDLIALGAGQNLPPVGAREESEGVEREGQGQPGEVAPPGAA